MLRFATKPDAVFTAILHDSLEDMRDTLAELDAEAGDFWTAQYPNAALCFTAGTAVTVLDQLLAASRDAQLYQLTDYHWLLLYDCLRVYSAVHNDNVEEGPSGALPVGSYQIGPIDFDALVDRYFWDTDFLLDRSTLAGLGPEGRESLGISDEVFGIAQGLPPHPEELKITPWEGPRWDEPDGQTQGPLIPQYPPAD
jgi:hypothetical protein